MSNPNLTELDYNQALKRCINSEEDAMRVELATPTGMSIELSAADGDSVQALKKVEVTSVAVNNASSGQIAVEDMSDSSQAQIMAVVVSAITGTCTVEMDISPDGVNWIPSGVTLAITGSANLKSAIVSDLGLNVRLRVVSNTISAGSATAHLLVRS
jgi:hypothetical protein